MAAIDVRSINIELIEENKVALRSVNRQDEKYIALVDSVRREGLLNPIVVKPTEDGKFRLIDGLHRFSACKDAGLTEIPCNIKDMTEAEILRAQIIANVHKIETRPIEYTRQLLRILSGDPCLTIAELAGQLSKSPAWLNERLNLIKLHAKLQDLVNENKINLTNAYALAKLPHEEQLNFLERSMTQLPGEFCTTVQARVKELRDAARRGREAPPEGFVPVFHLQKLSVLKSELEDPQIGPILCKENGVKTPEEGFALAIKWIGHLDARSVEAGRAKYDQRKLENEKEKEKKRKEREEKKLKEAQLSAD